MKMDSAQGLAEPAPVAARLLTTVQIDLSETDPGGLLTSALDGISPCHLFVFAPDRSALERICGAAICALPDTTVTGCTTAGQIGWSGFVDDPIVAVALPGRHFATHTVEIEDLQNLDPQALIDRLVQTRLSLAAQHPDMPNGFAFLTVDGLSQREDFVTAAIAPAMGTWPVFGGSAGDGTRFGKTWLANGHEIRSAVAHVTFVCTDCDAQVFSLNHLEPTGQKMVVTRADSERRIVKEINAEPAAREYARLIDKDPDQLDEFTFAAHPVVVRLGDTHHVRAIQRVNENGELVFFAAIDEGMVLNVATPKKIAAHLDAELSKMKSGRQDADIFVCDCLLRRIEAEQRQATRDLSDVMGRHHVVGFSTYGEQIGPLHVNQTMTGVMLVPPAD